MLSVFQKIFKAINKLTLGVGPLVSWLVLFMVVLLSLNVLSSWLFSSSSILLSESITWMHSANFLLAAGYTLNRNEHVRVDIFYSKMSLKNQAKVDLIGSLLLLLPTALFIFWSSWSYVLLSWRLNEVSAEAGGMAYLYILKGFLLLMPLLLTIEAINQIIHNILRLADPHNKTQTEGAN